MQSNINATELKRGDTVVCLLDNECGEELAPILEQPDDAARALRTWYRARVSRFAVALMTNCQFVDGNPTFGDSTILTFHDAEALLKAMPGLARTSGGSLWFTYLMDDVEPQVHAMLDGARILN